MRRLFLFFTSLSLTWFLSPLALANEAVSTVTVPWDEFDAMYRQQLSQSLLPDDSPQGKLAILSTSYDLFVHAPSQGQSQHTGIPVATGSILIEGISLQSAPNQTKLFDARVAITDIGESVNARLVASDGSIDIYAPSLGDFSIEFDVSIPLDNYQSKPTLEFGIPNSVRNELTLSSSDSLKLLKNSELHEVAGSYYFPPTDMVRLGFEHTHISSTTNLSEGDRLTEIETPESVLDSLHFSVSFTEDGSVLTAMSLDLPPIDDDHLALTPIADATIWSLHVNGQPRSLYRSQEDLWIIPLDGEIESKIEIAYLTANTPLALEGRLDFILPETGLTAQRVNVTLGLPKRIELLAMDSPLQAVSERLADKWSVYDSFSGEPHYFSSPFYQGQPIRSSIMYHEPVTH